MELACLPEACGCDEPARQQLMLDAACQVGRSSASTRWGPRERLANPAARRHRTGEKDIEAHMHVMVGVQMGRLTPVALPELLDLVADAVGHQTMDAHVRTEPPAPVLQICEVRAGAPLTLPHRRRDLRGLKGLGEVEVQIAPEAKHVSIASVASRKPPQSSALTMRSPGIGLTARREPRARLRPSSASARGRGSQGSAAAPSRPRVGGARDPRGRHL